MVDFLRLIFDLFVRKWLETDVSDRVSGFRKLMRNNFPERGGFGRNFDGDHNFLWFQQKKCLSDTLAI